MLSKGISRRNLEAILNRRPIRIAGGKMIAEMRTYTVKDGMLETYCNFSTS